MHSGKTFHCRILGLLSMTLLMSCLCACHHDKKPILPVIGEKDSLHLANLYDSACYYYDRGEYRTSMRFASEMEELACEINALEDLSCCWTHQIACYQSLGLTDSALIIAHLQIPIDSILGDPAFMASDYGNLGYIYLSQDRVDLAKKYALLALDYEKQVEDSPDMGVRYGLLCEIYNKLGILDSAIYYGRRAYAEDFVFQDSVRMGRRLAQLADAFVEQGNKAQAEKNYRQAISMFESQRETHSLSITCVQMGNLLLSNKKVQESISFFTRALEVNKEEVDVSLRAYYGLYLAYQSTDVSLALKYLEKYAALKDKQRSTETSRMLADYQARYETAEKDLKLLERDEYIHRIRIMLIASVLLIILVGILAVVFGHLSRIRNKNNQLLSKLDGMRSQFYTNLTHEFRTPLSIILGLTEKYTQGKASFQPSTVNEDFTVIQRQGRDLLTMVNQMLDFAKVSSEVGKKEWRHGDLKIALSVAIDAVRPLAQQKQISLVCDFPQGRIDVDFIPLYIDKMLRNLLVNSIKYTPEKGRVVVQLKRVKDNIMLSVSDNGIGIPLEDQDYIFLPFYQGHSSINVNSSGVGLSLVKQVVDAHNGTIHLDSKEGVGTTFTVTWPVAATNVETILEYAAESYSGDYKTVSSKPQNTSIQDNSSLDSIDQEATVLVVEDNEDLRKLMVDLLSAKYRVESAQDGVEALEIATKIIPDVILTDLMMPRMDGSEFCLKLRENPLLEHIPVIMVTAKDTESDRLTGLKEGAVEYITKPFVGEELVLRVDNLMNSLKAQRQLFEHVPIEESSPIGQLTAHHAAFLDSLTNVIFDLMSNRNLSTDNVAKALGITSVQLRRKLNAITGETTMAYIQRVRMDFARQMLLEHPEMSISEVALKCGYDETAHFSRAFKTVYNQTPSQVRK